MKHPQYELNYLGRVVATGNLHQIQHSIEEMKMPPVHLEKMKADLKANGEFHFGMGLYHINKRRNA
jgi:hypothetical protein